MSVGDDIISGLGEAVEHARLSNLIARLESAPEAQQRGVIEDALAYAAKQGWIDEAAFHRALDWCAVGAYESAAIALVPEGCGWDAGNDKDPTAEPPWSKWIAAACVYDADNDPMNPDCKKGNCRRAATPALALSAAALKAREAQS